MAIQSFDDKDAREFFHSGIIPKRVGWRAVSGIVARKLDILHYAARLDDLKSPPGNRLEALKGERKYWHSIRINDQWRIVFRWSVMGPESVQVLDYH